MKRASIWLYTEPTGGWWWAEVVSDADTDDSTQLYATWLCPNEDAATEAARQWMRVNGVEEVEDES